MSKAKVRTNSYQDLSSYQRSMELARQGSRVIYLHEAQYPLLQVEVLLRERSREQMGHLELAVLQLLDIESLEAKVIAALLGFSEPRLYNLIKELQGRSLIAEREGKFHLTELGKLSVKQGFEILEVKRALLLCGITGRLMPAATYEQPLSSVEQLARRAYGRILINETQSVPTGYLDITKLENKRDYSLPDEALEVVDLLDYEPRFLRGVLALHKTKEDKLQGEFCFANTSLNWLQAEQLIGFVEPIEWAYKGKKDRSAILNEICAALQAAGCELAEQRGYDTEGNPLVQLAAMSDSAMTLQIAPGSLRALLFFVGTAKHPPVPVFNFPRNKNLLAGHPLRLVATSESLQQQVDILRTASNALDSFYGQSSSDRGTAKDFVLAKLEEENHSLEAFAELVKRLKLRRFYSLLEHKDS